MGLHEGESTPDRLVVARLVAAQLPALAHEPIVPLASLGTVHHVFRIGTRNVARLPRLAEASEDFAREAVVLQRVSGRLPLAVPRTVHVGVPDDSFPHRWAVQEWLAGDPVQPSGDPAIDEPRAEALAAAIDALHRIDADGLPAAGRAPLRHLDEPTRRSIEATTELDRAALHAAWDRALEAPAWNGTATLIHADLLPPNLLESSSRLTGMIDWGPPVRATRRTIWSAHGRPCDGPVAPTSGPSSRPTTGCGPVRAASHCTRPCSRSPTTGTRIRGSRR